MLVVITLHVLVPANKERLGRRGGVQFSYPKSIHRLQLKLVILLLVVLWESAAAHW